ncbi:DUF4123 domain-containing protein [Vibrio sp. M260112]|uniref:DUF4123 domain-containing protein n=1 Tax=Vibrio sp. M260112 TaxID=3020895 RepID=UPI003FCD95D4
MNPSFELSKSEQLFLLVEGACIPDLERQLYQLPGVMEQEPIFLYPPYNQLLSVSPRLVKATPRFNTGFLTSTSFNGDTFSLQIYH